MPKQSRTTLKGYFEVGDIPTQGNYADLIDSQFNLSDTDTQHILGNLSSSANLLVGNIRASAVDTGIEGNISASGFVSASSFVARNNITATGNISSSLTGSFGRIFVDDFFQITASSDISSSGVITANEFSGTISSVAQPNITSLGTLTSLTISGDINANGNIVGDDETDITNIETIECDNVVHDGDTDTKMAFGDDSITFTAGDAALVTLTEAAANTIVLGDALTTFTGPVTTSSNISSSGYISGSNIIANETGSFGQLESTKFVGSRPIQTKLADGALVISDKGTYNRCGSHKLTIPLNSAVAFEIGTEIEFFQTSSDGHLMVTASAGDGVTLNSKNNLFSASGQFSAISCKKVGTDEWDIIGDLTI